MPREWCRNHVETITFSRPTVVKRGVGTVVPWVRCEHRHRLRESACEVRAVQSERGWSRGGGSRNLKETTTLPWFAYDRAKHTSTLLGPCSLHLRHCHSLRSMTTWEMTSNLGSCTTRALGPGSLFGLWRPCRFAGCSDVSRRRWRHRVYSDVRNDTVGDS